MVSKVASPIILGLLVVASVACQAPPLARPATGAEFRAPIDDRHVHREAQAELGPEVAEALPTVPRPAPQPADPGAVSLVESVLAHLGERQRGDDGVTRIGVWQLRNLSRAHASEFARFTERFAETLSRAGRRHDVLFIADPDGPPVQYELRGSAYLISAEGLDQWELFLSLTSVHRPLTLWQPERAVRVLRQSRPGQPQIVPGS
jgi:hypothetical protein